MKKIIAAAIAAMMIMASFAGCYDPLSDTNRATQAATDASGATVSTEAATEENKTYENNLAGLRGFLADKGYFKIDDGDKNLTTMQHDFVGAKEGCKIVTGNVAVELYEFPEKLGSTAEKVIASVKKNGTFDHEYKEGIPAYLSDNEKYLMIYTCSDIKEGDTSSDAYKTMQKCIGDFKTFNGVKGN